MKCQDCEHRKDNWCRAHEGGISKDPIFAIKCKSYKMKIETKQFKDGKPEEFEIKKGSPRPPPKKELCEFCHTTERDTTLDGKSLYIKHKAGCPRLTNTTTSTGY